MTVKNRSREETMQKLLDAGLTVFAKHGFDGATTRMVADEAGINESLINRYFDGKKGLLHAIILYFVESFGEDACDYPAGKTIEEEISGFIETTLIPCHSDINFMRLVISRVLVDQKLSDEIAAKIQHPAEVLLLNRLKAFQKKGLIKKQRDLQITVDLLHFFISGVIFKNAVLSNSKPADVELMIKKVAKQISTDLSA